MASLVRPTIVRWIGKDGKRVAPKTKGAKRVKIQSEKWYGQGIPGFPKSKRIPLAVDKIAAQRMLDNLVRDAERGSAGIPAASRTLTIDEHLKQFESDARLGLAARGKKKWRPSKDQLALVMSRLRIIIEGCRWRTVDDVNHGSRTLSQYLLSRAGRPRSDDGISHQTAQFYLSTAGRFAWWLSKTGAAVRVDAFDSIPGFDAKNERVHGRRDLLPGEIGRILTAARNGPIVRSLPGPERYYLYLTAFTSGFRAGELASLCPENFDLGADPPCLVLLHSRAKNKKRARQPIPTAVAAELRPWIRRKPPGKPVWPGPWRRVPVRMLRVDLKAAGVDYRVESMDGPKYADFHSLRHSFMSALAKIPGIGVKELQELARHSDPRLTMGTYAHTRPGELGSAVSRMVLPGVESNPPVTIEEFAALMLGIVQVLVARPVAQP